MLTILGFIFASTITDVGLAILLILVGVAAIMVARTAKELKATLPGIKFEVGQINRAVNHVKPGEPTLIAQVREISEWKNRQESLLLDHMKTVKITTERVADRMDTFENQLNALTISVNTPVLVIPHPESKGKLELDLE